MKSRFCLLNFLPLPKSNINMLQVKNVSFAYQTEDTLRNIEFTLEKGKKMAIIGESGCGKSTLLQLIYGLLDASSGQVFWKDNEILGPKYHLIPGMHYMKYLAQDFDLMPFITVAENVGKFLSNIYPEAKKKRIEELLAVVEMTNYANVKAKFLSGGQMQRVALARVLALEPEVLLLDEPFSHIDNFRKNSLRRSLLEYVEEKQITTIMATHDSTDILSLADEVLVMQQGRIIERGTPKQLYSYPKNAYIASLFGDVTTLIIDGKPHILYPHQLSWHSHSGIAVQIKKSYFLGSHYLIKAQHNDQIIYFNHTQSLPEDSKGFVQIN